MTAIAAGDADQDGSTAIVRPTKMEQQVPEGDIVRLKGRRDREALCVVKASKAVLRTASRSRP